MHTGHVVEQLRNANPAWQYSNIGDEGDLAHELFARAPRIASENLQFSFVRSEAKNRIERGSFAGAVRTDQSEDPAFFDTKIDIVQRDGCTKNFAEAACFYTGHSVNRFPFQPSTI